MANSCNIASSNSGRLDSATIAEPDSAFAKALVERTGIHRYCKIMQFTGDVSEDTDFQKLFNGYYNVRRPINWRIEFYALFKEARMLAAPDYERIIRDLHKRTGKVEPSFASKMLATVDDSKPVWDRRVVSALKRFDPTFPVVNTASIAGRIDEAVKGYAALTQVCNALLIQPEGKRCVARFDALLSEYSHISSMKKLDVVLWCAGN